jgi:YVTN family beta-propeller protein
MKAHCLILLLCFGAPPLRAQTSSTPSAAVLVLEKEQNTLVIIDPATLKVVGRVPVGNDPHEVAVSDDGRTAYVSNYGAFGGGGIGATIAVVDLTARKALAPIDLGALRAPHGVTFAGGKLYFTAEGAKVVGRYDPLTVGGAS